MYRYVGKHAAGYVFVYIYLNIHVYICMDVLICTRSYVKVYVSAAYIPCLPMWTYIYACMHACMHVRIHMRMYDGLHVSLYCSGSLV